MVCLTLEFFFTMLGDFSCTFSHVKLVSGADLDTSLFYLLLFDSHHFLINISVLYHIQVAK